MIIYKCWTDLPTRVQRRALPCFWDRFIIFISCNKNKKKKKLISKLIPNWIKKIKVRRLVTFESEIFFMYKSKSAIFLMNLNFFDLRKKLRFTYKNNLIGKLVRKLFVVAIILKFKLNFVKFLYPYNILTSFWLVFVTVKSTVEIIKQVKD